LRVGWSSVLRKDRLNYDGDEQYQLDYVIHHALHTLDVVILYLAHEVLLLVYVPLKYSCSLPILILDRQSEFVYMVLPFLS
jgi:hypothetical protein